ncbi:MAG: J domain-containing protein [bacterium]|nr:J domain-containing protein [bacterium]
MEYIDYYKILELEKSATEADIKKAYRKLARKYHPDVNPNDENAKKKFQQINEANEVLSDPENRKKYDKYGKDWKHAEQFEKQGQQQQRGPQGGFQGGGGDFSDNDFSDFFSSMFGNAGGGRSKTKYRGQDSNAQLQLDIKDAYSTRQQTLTINGKSIRITIPAGVENGQVIKLTGQGSPGANGGPNGDLYITFVVANNTPFKREGNNLYTSVDLDLYTALLGGHITIDTMSGQVKLPVKPETQTGAQVKLKGKGFPVYKKEGEFGDLFVTYKIKIPTLLSEKEKELFTELANIRK